MCLILFALDAHPRHRLVLAANRDEFHDRPAAPASWWSEAPHVLAGRDLRAGGTWMGVARGPDGLRWAAVTNIRDPHSIREGVRSRGDLATTFLAGHETPAVAAGRVRGVAGEFNPFNLLLGDARDAWFVSSAEPAPVRLDAGVHGLSNARLNTPWPKVAAGVKALGGALASDPVKERELLELLDDRTIAADEDLPDTGVGRAWERVLSSRFIVGDNYGSRCSTVLVLDAAGGGRFVERTFGPGGVPVGEVEFDL